MENNKENTQENINEKIKEKIQKNRRKWEKDKIRRKDMDFYEENDRYYIRTRVEGVDKYVEFEKEIYDKYVDVYWEMDYVRETYEKLVTKKISDEYLEYAVEKQTYDDYVNSISEEKYYEISFDCILEKRVSQCTEKEQIVFDRLSKGNKQYEIAKEIGVTQQDISKTKKSIVDKLRKN